MMRTPVVAILALLLPSGAGLAGEQDGKIEMILAAKVPNPRARRPLLRFDGAVPLPDMTVLFVSVGRSTETWNGGKLEPGLTGSGGAMAQLRERKFSLESPIDGPGLFSVRVDLREELQNPKVLDYIKKNTPQPRMWNFAFSAWNEDLLQTLVSSLQEFDLLAHEAAAMVRRYEAACKNEETWKAGGKEVNDENAKLLKRLEAGNIRAFFPAALNQVHYTIRNLQGNSPYFSFENGKFAGAVSYHQDDKKLKTFREEDFTFDNFKRYVAEAGSIAGREFSLWIVKDFRRAGNQLHPDAAEAVNQMKAHPGVADFADRLKALKGDDPALVDALDKDIRAAKLAPEGPKPEKK